MMNIPDLLEQMTWAINQGGYDNAGKTGKKEVFEFLSNIGRVIFAAPTATAPARTPSNPYSPDLLPLMEQMAWAAGDPNLAPSVYIFLYTISYYFRLTGPILVQAPYQKPTGPPLPPSLQSLPLDELPLIYQVAYWLINDGSTGNTKAWNFLQAIGTYLNAPIRTTGTGLFEYPYSK